MPPRKMKPISLAPVNLTDRKARKYPLVDRSAASIAEALADERKRASQPYDIAASALEKFSRAGYRAPVGPTPERLLKSAGFAKVDRFHEVVEVSRGDTFEPVTVEFSRVRAQDGRLEKLAARRALAPESSKTNLILFHAGLRYRKNWEKAGCDTLKGMDPTRESCGGSGKFGLFGSEAQANAWAVHNASRAAMFADFRAPVDAIVLEEREVEDVGRQFGAYRHAAMATAVAMFILRGGLKMLAVHYGMIAVEQTEGAEA